MSETKTFWAEHGFGNVEFCNTPLLSTALYDILEALETPTEGIIVASTPWRKLLDMEGGVFLIRYDDPFGFETAKTDFPGATEILWNRSILPRYFGEFEKDGVKYVIVDCEEKLAPKEEVQNWVPCTYRNMIYDRRNMSQKMVYAVKCKARTIFQDERKMTR